MQLTNAATITPRSPIIGKIRFFVLVAMIALADFLFFGQAPGLNLFLMPIALTAAVLLSASRQPHPVTSAAYLGVSVLAAAPLLEAPTVSGFILAMTAVILVSLANAKLLPKSPGAIPFIILRFLPSFVIRLPQACHRIFASHSGRTLFGTTVKSITGWLFPLGMGLVFLLLFSVANPLIEMGLNNIDLSFLLHLPDLGRMTLWLIAALVSWAIMRPRLIRRFKRRAPDEAAISVKASDFLDHTALVRCLSVFNLLFAMQTLLDLMYLWGGAELPAGMSHAEYAHRGAYPLVATALLAAAFVLIAMRRGGPGDHSRLIRILVIAWILQNVLLCLSSILRLDLYVETYSLTGLRIAAGIWMGLVAAGLTLILLRIALRRSNQWLISMNLATLATVLYLCAFFDFSGFIARFNVENSLRPEHQGEPLDIHYLASLGPSAIPAIDRYLASLPADAVERPRVEYQKQEMLDRFAARSTDWRSWSYRQHRTETYLQSTALIER
ncbi:DUF4173 domain-containing protein [Rhizobiales bacterium RZME27]|uniref:DUF4173 domain-containing protein n=1 Tax=Endobacterium cereale TaxID=2663029 RepID=A0A6A8A6T1_9HYPH|nr:DUF4173 domain-containing protein [Endobacterium cereale]MEB2844422.1 DUF4173 domain-containing protein [Endobacterium cereale]MQY47012.1 DUF4173 domain-containing protein [Endobacterium cereale]